MYVVTVAGTSASGSRAISSTAWHCLQTRSGGRLRVPHWVHFDATSPNFQSARRCAGGAATGSGSGRRGGSRSRNPRQDRKVAYSSALLPAAICAATGCG